MEIERKMDPMSCPLSDTVVSPPRLDFEVKEGWAYNPPAQWLYLEKANPAGHGVNWSAVSNQEWLKINPDAGAVPKRVRVDTASVGMPSGSIPGEDKVYQAEIRFTPSHVNVTPSVIPVTLTVRSKDQPPPPTFVCPHCGAEFTKEEERQKHIDQEHPSPPACLLTIFSTAGGSVITPGEGTSTYYEGRVVELVAKAEEGYRFVNWTGNVGTIANVNAGITTITMTGDSAIIANFEEIPPPEPEDNWLVKLWKRILDWLGINRAQ